jgi:outer membrane protein TolC
MRNWPSGKRDSCACSRTRPRREQMEQAVAERLQEGVDSAVDLNKAKLTAARVRLHRAEARGSADVLRRHLSNLTGLPVSTIEIAPGNNSRSAARRCRKKIFRRKRLPPVPQSSLPSSILWRNRCGLWASIVLSTRPSISPPSMRDSPPSTTTTSTTENFQPDNATIGFALRIPLFNASQRARADAAEG